MKRFGLLSLGLLTLFLCCPTTAQTGGDPVADLVQSLDDARDKPAQLKALKALGAYGNAARTAVPLVRLFLREKDDGLANQAAQTLAQIGRPAVPPLVQLLTDKNAKLRHRAAWALSLLGPEGKDAVAALEQALTDDNSEVRSLAAAALGEIGPAAQPACDRLVRTLADPNPKVRTQGAQALRRLGSGAVAALGKALSDEQPAVRQGAAQVLALLGSEAKTAVPQLTEAVKDTDSGVRLAAVGGAGGGRS